MENEIRKPGPLLDRKLLEMLIQAAAGEAAAANFYKDLSFKINNEADRKIVYDTSLDEVKHRRMFEELYHSLSGTHMPPYEAVEPGAADHAHSSLPDIFADRIKDELADVEFYRQIMFALHTMEFRDILFEIITDEMRHAQLFNYLYAKYK